MNIVKNEAYEQIAAEYQCLEIARLNEILKRHGIEDESTRKVICKEFIFDSGQFLDSGWFFSGSKKLWPELGFAERPVDPDKGLGEIETLYLADAFSFHEYANGDIYWYFDEHQEDASEIVSGQL